MKRPRHPIRRRFLAHRAAHSPTRPPQLDVLEPRMLLSVALPSFPGFESFLNYVIGAVPDQVKDLLPAEFFTPGNLPRSSFIYQALPGETNDVRVFGTLGNALLLVKESPDISVLRIPPAVGPDQLNDLSLQADLSGHAVFADISNRQVIIVARTLFSDVVSGFIRLGRLAII